uniref:Uncharacterized protein n=1 Tax=Arundo donax TaxID=35708 RepID=A0A0A9FVD4_ARUDO
MWEVSKKDLHRSSSKHLPASISTLLLPLLLTRPSAIHSLTSSSFSNSTPRGIVEQKAKHCLR